MTTRKPKKPELDIIEVIKGKRDTIDVRVTSSCGCIFCDIGLEPDEYGFHLAKPNKYTFKLVPCTKRN